jgi:hypothetical protein
MSTRSKRLSLVVFLPSTAILAAVAFAAIYKHVPVGVLTRDIADVCNVHPFTGILSHLGVLLWCSSAATCLFSSMILRQRQFITNSRFLLFSSLLTLILLFDDLFLFHEILAQIYLGLHENTVYVMHVSATIIYLIAFRRVIADTEYFILSIALGFFAISLILDAISAPLDPWFYLAEDGSKFLGIANWCAYFVETSFGYVAAAPTS